MSEQNKASCCGAMEAAAKIAEPRGQQPHMLCDDCCDVREWNSRTNIAAALRSAAQANPCGCEGLREAREHVLNEWNDYATSAMQWIKNIRDGITTPEKALACIGPEYQRVRALSASPLPAQGVPEKMRDALADLLEAIDIERKLSTRQLPPNKRAKFERSNEARFSRAENAARAMLAASAPSAAPKGE